MTTYERFIAISRDDYGGHWGSSCSRITAIRNCREAGGRKGIDVLRFVSNLPFAPVNRPANANEADCWCGQDGSINWIRCNRKEKEDDEKDD